MFGLLKKKLASFVDAITHKSEEAPEPQKQEPAPVKLEMQPEARVPEQPISEPASESQAPQQQIPERVEQKQEPVVELETFSIEPVSIEPVPPAPEPIESEPSAVEPAPPVKPVEEKPVFIEPSLVREPIAPAPTPKASIVPEPDLYAKPAPAPAPVKEDDVAREATEFLAVEAKPEKKTLLPKLGFLSKIKSVFSGTVTVSEAELKPMLEELEVALLENDVSFDTAAFLTDDLRTRLSGRPLPKSGLSAAVTQTVRESLLDLLAAKPFDLVERARAKKPFIILFLGPNGSGKTTTLAKIAHYLKKRGLTSVISASDTFRAAAIHQAVEHGEALGVRVVKHDYGADPAAVAFDAVAHAKANNIDVVLVDTAGRQETNYNLVREMEKINRVLSPDLKVFVGEAVAGHALIEQVKKMGEAVGGLDGIVLTKIDCDAKGGASLSVAHEAGIPVLFVGVGQGYDDLQPFDAKWFVERMLPENN
ncbi:MAG: signal recognition particle-docking protein FtsY [Candidatus Micrarchaeia archaeon]